MRRPLYILHALGLITMVWSFSLLLPYAASLYYEDGWDSNFLYAFTIAIGAGAVMSLIGYPFRRELRLRDGLLLVVLVWLLFPLIAAAPLLLPYSPDNYNFSFTHAYYEMVSGLTTTGSSVIVDITNLPASINIWRHSLIWFGGMGILVLAVAILPLLGVGGHQVMRGETPGPMKEEKLTPRIASTAKALYLIYFGLSLLCLLAYRWVGLNWFDAWCHTASTMGLGGFSSYSGGFAEMNNPLADLVACVFMLFAGINFATHFTAWRGRSLRAYLNCPEAIPFLSVTLFSALFISLYLLLTGYYSTPYEAFRYGFFNTISVATTTGFANTDYSSWPLGLAIWLLFIGCFATSAGSTGGGIKMIRILIILKQFGLELKRLLHPHGVFPLKLKSRIIDQNVVTSILLFLILFIALFLLITALLLIAGRDYATAFSAALASLANIGPGLGEVGPMGSYGYLSDFEIWVCTFAMIIGRLELFTVIVIFTPGFWRR